MNLPFGGLGARYWGLSSGLEFAKLKFYLLSHTSSPHKPLLMGPKLLCKENGKGAVVLFCSAGS
jgi:hypothetical protein